MPVAGLIMAKVRVQAKAAAGFWRAGRHFGAEGAELDTAELTPEQWAAIEREPQLVVAVLEPDEGGKRKRKQP